MAAARQPKTLKYAPVLLYRTIGRTLPAGMDSAAALWGIAQLYVQGNRKAAARAGFGGFTPFAGEKLFRALLDGASGVVYADSDYEESWEAVSHPHHRINLHIPELLPELAKLEQGPATRDPDYPLVLSAGERRSDTSNTAVRDAGWHRKGKFGTLRISPEDARAAGCADGEEVRLSTRRASIAVVVEVTDTLQPGHISLPNGQGLDYRDATGRIVRKGVAPNELTDSSQRDFLAGTPWHKHVPARLEKARPPAVTG
jgi:formate dehydrogenase